MQGNTIQRKHNEGPSYNTYIIQGSEIYIKHNATKTQGIKGIEGTEDFHEYTILDSVLHLMKYTQKHNAELNNVHCIDAHNFELHCIE